MLSEIALSNWKALYEFEIKFGKILFNLLVITLETSLYRILHNDIGQYSDTRVGHFTLGIKVIKVLFIDGGIEPVFRQLSTAANTSSPMVCQ